METIKIKGIDEVIYFTTSKAGLPLYVWKNDYAKSFYISLNVNYGSLHTEFSIDGKKYKVPQGIAHFMEHIKFNVDKDTTANDLFDPLGSDINAFTTFKYTSYLVYGTSKIKENLNALLDYVYNPYFTKEMIKKEKGIIASEINMGKDQPYNQLYFAFNKAMYHKEKYKYLITGEVEDIKKIELDDINLIYDAFYHPKNMFLIVTGNVNPYEIEQMVNENLDQKEFPNYLNPKQIPVKEPKYVVQEEVVIDSNVEVEKAKIGLIESGYIFTVGGRASIKTINNCDIDYVCNNARIGTINGGNIKFIQDKTKIVTINSANIYYVKNNVKIGTFGSGQIVGLCDNSQIATINHGNIDYVLDNARIGTINGGNITHVCDSAEISTINGGKVDELMGHSLIAQQMGGRIRQKSGNALIVYKQKIKPQQNTAQEKVTK